MIEGKKANRATGKEGDKIQIVKLSDDQFSNCNISKRVEAFWRFSSILSFLTGAGLTHRAQSICSIHVSELYEWTRLWRSVSGHV
jgi:hypothetical protein